MRGSAAGARQYVRVLQLLAEYPVKVVQEAIVQCRQKTTMNADHIIATVRRLGDRPVAGGARSPRGSTPLPAFHPVPKLDHFDLLITPKTRRPR